MYAMNSDNNLARSQSVHLNRRNARQENRQGGEGQTVPSRGRGCDQLSRMLVEERTDSIQALTGRDFIT